MGWFGRSAKSLRPEQKWDYITLQDFKATGPFTPIAYGWLYISLTISLAVYAVDTFTAYNLLFFNRWSSTVTLTKLVSFDVSKWIFSICIIASFVNLAYEHLRARRVMKRGSVAECYLDNLAVRLESCRMGKGQGWRRFLVFAELTKSRKGAEYVALFTYFSFQSWIRVMICSGPRQAINALSLYSVWTSDVGAIDNSSVGNTFSSLFAKIEALASTNTRQSIILSGMLFTLVIWVFSAIFLLIAILFYVFFLWHYIPKDDGGLTRYCERKINKRLMNIVSVKINKAIADQEKSRLKAELKVAKKKGGHLPPERKATLPSLMSSDSFSEKGDDGLPEMPTLPNLAEHDSRPGTPNSIGMGIRPPPTKQGTNLSTQSSRAPLLSSASAMGTGPPPMPAHSLPPIDRSNYGPPRSGTANSHRTNTPGPAGMQFNVPYRSESPAIMASPSNAPAMPRPTRTPGPGSMDYNRSMPRAATNISGGLMHPYGMNANGGRSSPAPAGFGGYPNGGGNYNGAAYQPTRNATTPVSGLQRQQTPPRNTTAPLPSGPVGDVVGPRPGTAASQRWAPDQGYGSNMGGGYYPPR